MKTISIENVSKTYGEKQLFQKLSLTIQEGEKIGLIGINGTGKSTLLKIISGIEEPDEGTFDHPKDYRITYLSQNPSLEQNLTILEQVYKSDAEIMRVIREYEKCLLQLQQMPENERVQETLFTLQRDMDRLNAWDANATAKTVLSKLGILDVTQKIGELSGGQKRGVALAQCLIEKPDLLILDEPTNHLDYATITWLQEFLVRYQQSVLFVTHDRYFLDAVTNRIIELDKGRLFSYKGNYEMFIESKTIREVNEQASMSKAYNLYRNELKWMRRGAKARTTKQKARIDRFQDLEGSLDNRTDENLELNVKGARLGKKVFELQSVTKKFDSNIILDDFSFLFKKGDRIGIVGENGAGKTTFLNILAGLEKVDSGEIERGQTVKLAYYTQESEEIPGEMRMIDYLRETAEVVTLDNGDIVSVSNMLERFLFPMSTHGTLIRKLSGGERRRLFLLKLLMENPNVLLLDEPTNDLDTQTLTILEDYLHVFPGVVITVSHDRYFLDKITTQLFVFKGNGAVASYYGTYSEFLESEKEEEKQKPKELEIDQSVTVTPNKEQKKKMTYKEKIEWETIEAKIEEAEVTLKEKEEELNGVGSDFERANTVMSEISQLNEELEILMERWEYLSSFQ
ncbi:multidrug ABC transporter ATP-binding protein [Bacillus coahuilensis p1.1.43]|uniref:Multidrug ABC transporter ATP-binding protein n=1 Tax=Bacillus coahuilensis p1.1.43 TaxID=1150625 RepID=A0A147K8H2_9BACI|nr:ABC-F family ATP-binding cassette domain-containing protein [Bacillus coahuilensis]KUP06500.1 multidrug ABC transporter ATP-binding protein [Bacillus coahuilensis p1.1.43]